MSSNQNNTGKQENNSDTSFKAKKPPEPKVGAKSFKADKFNKPSERPSND